MTKGGLKLEYALGRFSFNASGLSATDLGCHKGGFTDCLLQHGAARVYAVDTAYGVFDWKLRNDPRVRLHERTNLIHWTAPEPVDLVVIDAGWTPQRLTIPAALRSLKPSGAVLSLLKPQYETGAEKPPRGLLPAEQIPEVLAKVHSELSQVCRIDDEAESPIRGSGGNIEYWLLIRPL